MKKNYQIIIPISKYISCFNTINHAKAARNLSSTFFQLRIFQISVKNESLSLE
jgi:hypothetical protein